MKRAIIIGGGLGGLASAKVLSAYFDKVTIYDAAPAPQMQHLHILLRSGQDILEKIFPGIMQKLLDHRCPEIDWAQDTLWENHIGAFPRYPSSIKTLTMGRILLQNLMGEYLNQLSNVEFIERRVDSLTQVEAELYIISGGQNFPLEKFLGDVLLAEESGVIDLTYRSYQYKLNDLKMKDFKQYYFQMDPPYSYVGGVISPIENGEAIVTLIEKEKTLSRCQGLEEFQLKAEKIQNGKFLEIIQGAIPITSLSLLRKTTTHRKVLAVNKVPEKVFILGDVLTSLNPVFGQGMTLTLMQVEILDRMLGEKNLNSCEFHRQSHKLGQLPHFLSSAGSDESGLKKILLRFFLRTCQKIRPLHHLFLCQLHSLGKARHL